MVSTASGSIPLRPYLSLSFWVNAVPLFFRGSCNTENAVVVFIFSYPLMAPINNTQEIINAGPSNPTRSPPSLKSFCSINPVL